MKLSRTLAASFAALVLSGSALAQMGGGHGPGGSGGGSGMGGSGMFGPDMRGPGFGGPVAVAPDGKAVYVKRATTTSGSTTTTTIDLVAIGRNGNVAWSYPPSGDIRQLSFPTGLVAFVVLPQQTANTMTGSSTIVALDLASGAQAWTLAIDGMVGDLTETSSGLYATVMKATTSGSTTTASRSLVSITLTGSIAWSATLD